MAVMGKIFELKKKFNWMGRNSRVKQIRRMGGFSEE
jgi:hypothetical protein